MVGRLRKEIAKRDLSPALWRDMTTEHGRLPSHERAAFARVLHDHTGLSLASVYRRLGGHFPGRVGRKQVSTAEQRELLVAALERTNGRLSPMRFWQEELGAPERPSLATIRRLVRIWRRQQLAAMQLPLPLGPDRPTMFSGATAGDRKRTREDVARDAMAVFLRVFGRHTGEAA